MERSDGVGVLACLLTLALPAEGLASKLPITKAPYDLRGARIYSDLCVEPKTDDINGLRIIVRPRGARPRVLAQYAEGGLPEPTEAFAAVKAGRLQFEVAGDVPEASFSGEVRNGYVLVRSHAPGAKAFRLKAIRRLHTAPPCY